MYTLLVMVKPSSGLSLASPLFMSTNMCSSDYLSPDSLPAFICSCSSILKLYSIHGALKLIISEIAECGIAMADELDVATR